MVNYIIFILVDDAGIGDFSPYGCKYGVTPHIDRLANEGMKFTRAYSGSAVCAPSRYVLMTGQHGGRTRVRGNGPGATGRGQELRADDVTVAAVIERDGRFLLVEEHTAEGLRLNNPAGHLDPGESLVEAVARETLEETMHAFTPTALVGVYMSRFQRAGQDDTPDEDITYLRFAYCGELGDVVAGRALDTGTGLGLTITHLLSDMMGGDLRLRYEHNWGAADARDRGRGAVRAMTSAVRHRRVEIDAALI